LIFIQAVNAQVSCLPLTAPCHLSVISASCLATATNYKRDNSNYIAARPRQLFLMMQVDYNIKFHDNTRYFLGGYFPFRLNVVFHWGEAKQ
jgi:hypothetical protein